MPAHRTARERARAELTTAIKDEARTQLADKGAAGLSLRAVARELEMVSSAIYRYFPSRDELLTALILDAYTALGDALAEAIAAVGDGPFVERWRAAAHALRDWARAHPHEYALLYGTPVPGYRAPTDTVGPAGRIPGAFLRIAHEAWRADALADPGGPLPTETLQPETLQPETLQAQTGRVIDVLELPGMPAELVLATIDAWTQLFGAVALEINGQFVGSFDPADDYFVRAVERQTRLVGLS
ncbi:TetR family transcriptional regulator [Saccharomonospora sp. CUA-673]|uniref:TetR/AcrR family transcriptional regulator n=1 Tax=Saccharomonospora sp. CUA-673 TaxID=1904969 RepID=UPI000963DB04|nr:TetR/AcrR family transcriptional regulator [Saccharomonospora sp. CUA-673]OLT45368.1 TetR family transcriptional regulator [Saccharomonospora sp. CUA-673]